MKFRILFVLLLIPTPSPSALADVHTEQKIQEVINACAQHPSHQAERDEDKLCKALVTFKNIGDDAIEAVKEYTNLTPRDYAILTVVNYMVTGRLRIRTKSFFIENGNNTLDIKKEEVVFITEFSF